MLTNTMGREEMRRWFVLFLYPLVLLLGACSVPCDWALPGEFCNPVDIDADVIGDTGVSLVEIPSEYQVCMGGIVSTYTQICEHTGGEAMRECSVPPPGSNQLPICQVVTEPLVLFVKECLLKDLNGAPTKVILCEKCSQDLSTIDGVEDLKDALKPAPLCRNPKLKDGMPYLAVFCGLKPALNVNYCT